MAETLRGGLSLGLSGFGVLEPRHRRFRGHAGRRRLQALAGVRPAVLPLAACTARSSYRVPWAFDDEAVEVTRQFTKLKMPLMPYLCGSAVEAHRTGRP